MSEHNISSLSNIKELLTVLMYSCCNFLRLPRNLTIPLGKNYTVAVSCYRLWSRYCQKMSFFPLNKPPPPCLEARHVLQIPLITVVTLQLMGFAAGNMRNVCLVERKPHWKMGKPKGNFYCTHALETKLRGLISINIYKQNLSKYRVFYDVY